MKGEKPTGAGCRTVSRLRPIAPTMMEATIRPRHPMTFEIDRKHLEAIVRSIVIPMRVA